MSGRNSTNKRKSSKSGGGNVDFKRRKAKVGKRAVQPANSTDTKFKVGTVNVSSQRVGNNKEQAQSSKVDEGEGPSSSSLFWISRIGKSLDELIVVLNHPAATPRVSSCKGILDIVRQAQDVMMVHRLELSTLVPPISKAAFLDDDDGVRSIGLDTLERVLSSCRSSLRQEADARNVIPPFGPLLWAFCQSGLESLDKSIRFHAAKGVGVLATHEVPLGEEVEQEKLWPAISRLLAEYPSTWSTNQNSRISEGNKKKKRASDARNSTINKRLMILESLAALRRTKRTGSNHRTETRSTDQLDPNHNLLEVSSANGMYICKINSRARNQLVQQRLCEFAEEPFGTFFCSTYHGRQISISHEKNETPDIGGKRKRSSRSVMEKDWTVLEELMRELQNGLVVLMQIMEASGGQLNLSQRMELSLTIQCHHKILVSNAAATTQQRQRQRWRGQCRTIHDMLLQIFPVATADSDESGPLNHHLCMTLLQLIPIVNKQEDEETKKVKNKTRDAIVDYLLPRIDTVVGVQVLGDILRTIASSAKSTSEEDREAREVILEAFEREYFTIEKDDENGSAANVSSEQRCRPSALTAITFMANNSIFIPQLRSLALPVSFEYLISWKNNFPSETERLLSTILDWTKTLSTDSDIITVQEKALLQTYRMLFHRFVSNTMATKEMPEPTTLFEQFHPRVQRLLLVLMVRVGIPSLKTLHGLSMVCARSTSNGSTSSSASSASWAMADFIIEQFHSVRRSVRLDQYLTCLIQCLPKRWSEDDNNESNTNNTSNSGTRESISQWTKNEKHVCRVARALIRCGTHRVLPLLSRFFEGLIDKSSLHKKEQVEEALMNATTCFSILALMAKDLYRHSSYETSCLFELSGKENLFRSGFLTKAWSCTYELLWKLRHSFKVTQESAKSIEQRLMKPMAVLLRVEPKLVEQMLSYSIEEMKELARTMTESEAVDSCQSSSMCSLIQSLISLLREPIVATILQVEVKRVLANTDEQKDHQSSIFGKDKLELELQAIFSTSNVRSLSSVQRNGEDLLKEIRITMAHLY